MTAKEKIEQDINEFGEYLIWLKNLKLLPLFRLHPPHPRIHFLRLPLILSFGRKIVNEIDYIENCIAGLKKELEKMYVE